MGIRSSCSSRHGASDVSQESLVLQQLCGYPVRNPDATKLPESLMM